MRDGLAVGREEFPPPCCLLITVARCDCCCHPPAWDVVTLTGLSDSPALASGRPHEVSALAQRWMGRGEAAEGKWREPAAGGGAASGTAAK